MINSNKTVSISIMSGKGGVGKTNMSLNLGCALNQAGKNVLLMDCDLGLANLDVLLGITPDKNLQDLLLENTSSSDVVIPIEPKGFDVLPAASGVPELVEMDEDMQDVLFKKLTELVSRYQYLILDLGAGISRTVMSFAASTQLRLVVLTPEPTSLTDSYALIKVLNTQHHIEDFLVVVNDVESKAQAQETFHRLDNACKNFLGIEIRNLGYIRHDPKVIEAVRDQIPFFKKDPNSLASKDILALSDKLLRYRQDNLDVLSERKIMKQFPSASM